jgi:hypothetical protein
MHVRTTEGTLDLTGNTSWRHVVVTKGQKGDAEGDNDSKNFILLFNLCLFLI